MRAENIFSQLRKSSELVGTDYKMSSNRKRSYTDIEAI